MAFPRKKWISKERYSINAPRPAYTVNKLVTFIFFYSNVIKTFSFTYQTIKEFMYYVNVTIGKFNKVLR
jgi:hypothetical protein